MDKFLFDLSTYFLTLSVVSSSLARASLYSIFASHACYGAETNAFHELMCPPNHKIRTVRLYFGAKTSGSCNYVSTETTPPSCCRSGPYDCEISNLASQSAARKQCDTRRWCLIQGERIMIRWQCERNTLYPFTTYSTIKYMCIPDVLGRGRVSTACYSRTITKISTLSLICREQEQILVIRVSYGTKASTSRCPEQPRGIFRECCHEEDGDCVVDSSIEESRVKRECDGKTTCHVRTGRVNMTGACSSTTKFNVSMYIVASFICITPEMKKALEEDIDLRNSTGIDPNLFGLVIKTTAVASNTTVTANAANTTPAASLKTTNVPHVNKTSVDRTVSTISATRPITTNLNISESYEFTSSITENVPRTSRAVPKTSDGDRFHVSNISHMLSTAFTTTHPGHPTSKTTPNVNQSSSRKTSHVGDATVSQTTHTRNLTSVTAASKTTRIRVKTHAIQNTSRTSETVAASHTSSATMTRTQSISRAFMSIITKASKPFNTIVPTDSGVSPQRQTTFPSALSTSSITTVSKKITADHFIVPTSSRVSPSRNLVSTTDMDPTTHHSLSSTSRNVPKTSAIAPTVSKVSKMKTINASVLTPSKISQSHTLVPTIHQTSTNRLSVVRTLSQASNSKTSLHPVVLTSSKLWPSRTVTPATRMQSTRNTGHSTLSRFSPGISSYTPVPTASKTLAKRTTGHLIISNPPNNLSTISNFIVSTASGTSSSSNASYYTASHATEIPSTNRITVSNSSKVSATSHTNVTTSPRQSTSNISIFFKFSNASKTTKTIHTMNPSFSKKTPASHPSTTQKLNLTHNTLVSTPRNVPTHIGSRVTPTPRLASPHISIQSSARSRATQNRSTTPKRRPTTARPEIYTTKPHPILITGFEKEYVANSTNIDNSTFPRPDAVKSSPDSDLIVILSVSIGVGCLAIVSFFMILSLVQSQSSARSSQSESYSDASTEHKRLMKIYNNAGSIDDLDFDFYDIDRTIDGNYI